MPTPSSSLTPLRLGIAAAVSAALAIASGPLAMPWLLYVFKPLTTLLVMAFAWPRGAGEPGVRRWLRVGLVFSLGGDVALMWPVQGFLPGLVSFLLAHLAFIVAFTRDTRFFARPMPFAAYGALAAAILCALWPGIPAPLRAPVVVYVACLASMAAQAAARWRVHAEEAGARWLRTAAVGAGLFMVSDALIAIDRFHAPIPASQLWILALYWTALWCIASSLKPPVPGA